MTPREAPWCLEEAAEADRLRDAIRAVLVLDMSGGTYAALRDALEAAAPLCGASRRARLLDGIRTPLRCDMGHAAFRELAALLPHAALIEALSFDPEKDDAPRWLIGRDRGRCRMKTRPDSA